MDKHTTSCLTLKSYEEVYNTSIKPKLESIDLFLRENIAPFHIYEVAHILEIEPDELSHLMQKHSIAHLDTISFFTIVLNASSEICQLLTRQWHYAMQKNYTPEMIAEIYKLNIHKVKCAFDELNTCLVQDIDLPQVFKRIHLTVF
ncbi:MAG: hypothetical protein E7231_12025 [Cellulosilyticum sp.]|nr:hypothetical protein [Cellulosilyticum sp.]